MITRCLATSDSTRYWTRSVSDIIGRKCVQRSQPTSNKLSLCHSCQQIKPPHSNNGLLQPITVSEPFELIGWDIIGPFPESQAGNKYILVMSEYLTRWTKTAAILDARAINIATKLMERIIFPYGCPARIMSD